MKNIYIIALMICFVFPFKGFTQEVVFAPVGAIWHYKISSTFTLGGGYAKFTAEKDTIIEGRKCAVITCTYLYHPAKNTQKHDSTLIVIKDSLKVFLYNYGKFTTLYDFSASKGDSWETETDFRSAETVVIEDDSVMIENRMRKRLIVTYTGFAYQDTLIEGIGSVRGLHPYIARNKFMFGFLGLNCYEDSSLFYKRINGPCETPIIYGVEDIPAEEDISIFPNPFREQFTISINNMENKAADIYVYDLAGRVIFTAFNHFGRQISLKDLQPGTYLLKINTGEYYYQKIIVKM